MAARERRKALRRAGVVLLLILGLGAATVVIVPRASAGFVIRGAAELLGLGPATLDVTQAGWRSLVAEHVGIGKAIAAERIQIGFGGFGPFGGVKSAAIRGLRANETLAPGGTGGGALPRLPLFLLSIRISLEDTAIRLVAPGAAYSAVAPGIVTLAKEASAGSFDLALTPTAQAPGAFMAHHGTLSVSGGAVSLSLAPVGAAIAGYAHAALTARLESGTGGAPQVTIGLKDVALPALGIALKSLTLSGHINATAQRVALMLDDCIRAQGLVMARLDADSLPVCPAPDGKPVLSLALGGAAAEALTADAVLRDAKLRVAGSDGAPLLSGVLPVTALAATSDAGLSDWHARLSAAGGDLHGPSGLVLNDMSATAGADAAGGRLTRVEAVLVQARLFDPRPKPVIAPVTLTASAHTTDHRVSLAANAAAPGLPRLLHAEGSHDLASGAGEATLALAPLAFDPKGLTPQSLSPALAGQIAEAKGNIRADGVLSWGAVLESHGALHLEKLAARLPLGRFDGLDGTVNFASLLPLATAQPQNLRAGLLDIGLPLTDGEIKLSVEGAADVRIHDAHWHWLGGTVGLASGLFSPFRSSQALTFAIDKIDLKQLLVLADVKGLSGTGLLSGRIPVTLESGHQPVHGGALAADPPGGTLIYKTGEAGAGPSAILHTALDNFQYDSLTAEIGGDLAGTLSLQVHLKGRNPDLYDGRRIELNLTTEGAFVDMLRKGLGASRAGSVLK